MGIACDVGDRGDLRNEYMAPECCKKEIQTEKVDCFGVGLVLHEIYQREIALLENEGEVKFRAGMPSDEYPMPGRIKEAMLGLLEIDPDKRWALEDLLRSPWFQYEENLTITPSLRTPHEQVVRTDSAVIETREYLTKYATSATVSAYGAYITAMQSHIVGKVLGEMPWGEHRPVILLMKYSDGKYERVPGRDTKITAGSWIYFGIYGSVTDSSPNARKFGKARTERGQEALESICQVLYKRKFQPKVRDVGEQGRLVPFMPEFDIFEFPDRKGDGSKYEYCLGPRVWADKQIALDVRRTMNINICGIIHVNRDGSGKESFSEEWFPGVHATARPGDFGLVVRAPREDGLSEPTLDDDDLDPLIDPESYDASTEEWTKDHDRFTDAGLARSQMYANSSEPASFARRRRTEPASRQRRRTPHFADEVDAPRTDR